MPWKPPRARPAGVRKRYPLRQPPAGNYGYEWRKTRAYVLARDPVCVSCHRRPSKICDHIIPRRQGGSDDESNLRGVCVPCDRRDSIRYDGGYGRTPRPGKQGT